jgi:hypothetical protein
MEQFITFIRGFYFEIKEINYFQLLEIFIQDKQDKVANIQRTKLRRDIKATNITIIKTDQSIIFPLFDPFVELVLDGEFWELA